MHLNIARLGPTKAGGSTLTFSIATLVNVLRCHTYGTPRLVKPPHYPDAIITKKLNDLAISFNFLS